jgi:hypothetical protein
VIAVLDFAKGPQQFQVRAPSGQQTTTATVLGHSPFRYPRPAIPFQRGLESMLRQILYEFGSSTGINSIQHFWNRYITPLTVALQKFESTYLTGFTYRPPNHPLTTPAPHAFTTRFVQYEQFNMPPIRSTNPSNNE